MQGKNIIVEDFITGLDNEVMFENYLSTYKDISENHPADGPRYVTEYYNIEKLIQEKQNHICELVNNVWKVNVDKILPVTNMISKGQNLTIHNDYDIEDIHYMPPVRGIIGSTQSTSKPSPRLLLTKWRPTKPAPPVIKTLMIIYLLKIAGWMSFSLTSLSIWRYILFISLS